MVLCAHVSLQLDRHCQEMQAAGICTQILVCLAPRLLVLKKRTRQLTVKHGNTDGLACVCALCLKVRLKTLLVDGDEVLEGLLENVHRSRHTHTRMGRSLNLLLALSS
jgi:hypothetical protein